MARKTPSNHRSVVNFLANFKKNCLNLKSPIFFTFLSRYRSTLQLIWKEKYLKCVSFYKWVDQRFGQNGINFGVIFYRFYQQKHTFWPIPSKEVNHVIFLIICGGLLCPQMTNKGGYFRIGHFLKWAKNSPRTCEISVRQIASHTSGIRHYKKNPDCKKSPNAGDAKYPEFYSNEHYETIEEALKVFQDDDLLFEPGAEFSYTTYGFTLLSAVIESASGKE